MMIDLSNREIPMSGQLELNEKESTTPLRDSSPGSMCFATPTSNISQTYSQSTPTPLRGALTLTSRGHGHAA